MSGYDALWGDQDAIRQRAITAVLAFEPPGGVSCKAPLTVPRMLLEPGAAPAVDGGEGPLAAEADSGAAALAAARGGWPQRFAGVRQYQAFFHDALVQEAHEQVRQALPRGTPGSVPWRAAVVSVDPIAAGLLRVCLRTNRQDAWLEAAGWSPPLPKGSYSPFPQEKSVALLSTGCRPFPWQSSGSAGARSPPPVTVALITRASADAAVLAVELLVTSQGWIAMLESSSSSSGNSASGEGAAAGSSSGVQAAAAATTAAAPATSAAKGRTGGSAAGAAPGKGRAAPAAAAESAYVRADGLLDSLLGDDDDEDEEEEAQAPPPPPPAPASPVPAPAPAPAPPQDEHQWLYFWTLCSVVTNLREAEALYSLHTYDPRLVGVLLDPGSKAAAAAERRRGSTHSNAGLVSFLTPALRRRFYPSHDYQRLYLLRRFNVSQRAAINAAVLGDAAPSSSSSSSSSSSDAFTGYTLVQGPPGTGKSSTILGMINTLHLCAYNYYHETLLGIVSIEELLAGRGVSGEGGVAASAPTQVPSLLRSVHGALQWLMTCATPVETAMETVHTAVGMRPRLLVTAPSNTAVDNLVLRLHRDGLRGGVMAPPPLEPIGAESNAAAPSAAAQPELEVYHAPLVRVGDGAGPEVRESGLHLEREVNRLLDAPLEALDDALTGANAAVSAAVRDIDSLRRRYQAELASVAGWAGVSLDAPVPPSSPAAAAFREAWLRYAGPLLTCVNNYTRARAAVTRLRFARSVHEVPARERNAQAGTARRELRNALLENAELVFTTTASSALATLENFIQETGHRFDIVIVDEAGQAVEPSTLIPLRYGCAQAILVGDPFQLPPTVLSPAARARGYSRSLFARFMEAGHATHLLSQQYRSHPAVSAFPSAYFYGGRVVDDASVLGAGRRHPLHTVPAFRPLVVYNVYTGAESKGDPSAGAAAVLAKLAAADGGGSDRSSTKGGGGGGGLATSTYNEDEALVVCKLLEALAAWRGRAPSGHRLKFTGSVGVISFYKAQVVLLKEVLSKRYGVTFQETGREGGKRGPRVEEPSEGPAAPPPPPPPSAFPFSLEVNTVDAFQGQERDIIILSSVRTPAGYARASRAERQEWVAADTLAAAAVPGGAAACLLARVNATDAEGGALPPWLPPGYTSSPVRRATIARMLAAAEVPGAAIHEWAATTEALEAAVGGEGAPASLQQSGSLGSVIGFVDDPRRMNVGLTRARFGCWVVGHTPALSTSTHWRAFLAHAARAGAVVGVEGDPLTWAPPTAGGV